MSGICAVSWKSNPQRTIETLHSLCRGLSIVPAERIEHAVDGDAAVGMSARSPTQQVFKSDRICIVCDADLRNIAELTRLVGASSSASQHSQASLLALLYERFGRDFVVKLNGNFSLVLWDCRERSLLAAVDNFGANRLVYYEDPRGLLIASRVDSLVRCGEVEASINPQAIPNLLNYSSNLGPGTILKSVQRLLPGTMLIASAGKTVVKPYWDMRYEAVTGSSERRMSAELEAAVEDAVKRHCSPERFAETGAFLSGGTDSSTVVGMMSRIGAGPAKAFSIGFQEQPFNELGYAELAAKKFGAQHHTYLVGPEDCFEAIPEMIRCFDEPFGNASAIPTYFCARLAAQNGVKVLLAGDGGDELFGGNERYATDRIFEVYHLVPSVLRKRLIEPVLAHSTAGVGLIRRAQGYIRRANMAGIERMLSFQFLSTHAPEKVFDPGFHAALGGYSTLEVPSRYYAQAPARDHLNRMLYVDLKITLGDNDLPKVTCMSELAGIHTRFPFLDRSVAELSGRIPAHLKVKGFEKRYLFKKAFRNLLPPEILRKKKHGFGIPVAVWMKTDPKLRDLTRGTLLSQRSLERGYFQRDFIEDLFRKHESDDSTYYGDTIWTLLALELWYRNVMDQPMRMTA